MGKHSIDTQASFVTARREHARRARDHFADCAYWLALSGRSKAQAARKSERLPLTPEDGTETVRVGPSMGGALYNPGSASKLHIQWCITVHHAKL